MTARRKTKPVAEYLTPEAQKALADRLARGFLKREMATIFSASAMVG